MTYISRSLALAAIAGVMTTPSANAESLRKDAPLSELMEIARNGTIPERSAAIFYIGEKGEEGKTVVPWLISLLDDQDWNIRAAAIGALGKFGPAAREAVPLLESRLKAGWTEYSHDYPGCNIVHSLAAIGESALPTLSEALSAPNETLRFCTADALAKLGPVAAATAPMMIESLRTHKKRNDTSTIDAYGQHLSSLGPGIAPALLSALNDQEYQVRAAAAMALGRMQPPVRQAIARLTLLLDDGNEVVRKKAIDALDALAQDMDEVARKVEEARVRDSYYPIPNSKMRGRAAVPDLIRALQNKEWEKRHEALTQLAELGTAADEAIAPIIALLDTDASDPMGDVQGTLLRIAPKSREVMAALFRKNHRQIEMARPYSIESGGGSAAQAIRMVGTEEDKKRLTQELREGWRQRIADLVQKLSTKDGSDWEAAWEVANQFCGIKFVRDGMSHSFPASSETFHEIRMLAEGNDNSLRGAAFQILTSACLCRGLKDPDNSAFLLKLANQEGPQAKEFLQLATARIGDAAALEQLKSLVAMSPQEVVRFQGISVLEGLLGSDAAPLLEIASKDVSSRVRKLAEARLKYGLHKSQGLCSDY